MQSYAIMSPVELYSSGVGWFVIPVCDPLIIFPSQVFDMELVFPDFYIWIMMRFHNHTVIGSEQCHK